MSGVSDCDQRMKTVVHAPKTIADARHLVGLTQEQLAEQVRVERTTVQRWESGVQDPQPWMRPRLAKALHITAAELADILARRSSGGQPGEAAGLLASEIRRIRTEMGLSQSRLAQGVGYTRQYIAMAERPQKNLPSADLIRALDGFLNAEGTLIALRERARLEQRSRRQKAIGRAIDPDAGPVSEEQEREVSTAILELRDALTDYRHSTTPSTPVSLGDGLPIIRDLRRDLEVAFNAYQQSRFTIAAIRVSKLVSDAQTAVKVHSAAGQGDAHGLLALSYQAAASVLVKAGESHLAWIAAERGLGAAESSANLAIKCSLIRSVAFSLLATGHLESAMKLIESGARLLEHELDSGNAFVSVYGTFFLVGAMAAARFGDAERAADYLDEADSAARRLGRDANDLWTAFGPTNVAIHRVNAAAELGDMQTVLDSIESLDAAAPVERRVRYLLDVARAYGVTGKPDEALGTIIKAERLAPEHVRQHHLARRVVTTLVRNSLGRPGIQLEKLARRVNVAMVN